MNKKNLLIFAHRGEALEFFNTEFFQPIPFFFEGFFESEKYFLLICGEGIQNASEKTTAILAVYCEKINLIINLGIAGALNEKFKKNDLIWARTSLAENTCKVEFKTFTSDTKIKSKNYVDCISTFERVLKKDKRKLLSNFASIVDRELWGIASSAQLFKIPFMALKIISDELELNTSDKVENSFIEEKLDLERNNELCSLIKQEAHSFSKKLKTEFEDFFNLKTIESNVEPEIDLILNNQNFYFTTSQKRKYLSIKNNLIKKNILTNEINLTSFLELNVPPKDRTKELLNFLSDLQNPIAKKIRVAISRQISCLEIAGVEVQYDPNFEESWILISTKLHSTRDLEKIKNALKIFSYEEFKEIFNGKI